LAIWLTPDSLTPLFVSAPQHLKQGAAAIGQTLVRYPFKKRSYTLSAANASSGYSIPCILKIKYASERTDKPVTRSTERMTDSSSATLDIDFVRVNAKFSNRI
jgi:hypothetical protein